MPVKKAPKAPKHFNVGDIVLGKIKGFPLWPSQVVTPEDVPAKVRKEAKKDHLCIQFFPAGDYSWSLAKDLVSLSSHEIKAFIDKPKKRGDLSQAYKIALDPSSWNANRAQAEEMYADTEMVDELEEEDEEEGEAAQGQKRKRKEEKEDPEAKKRAKTAKKAELTKLAASRAAGGSKGDVGAYSEDEAEPTSKKAKTTADANEDPNLTKVRGWRHKLQKIFLNEKVPIPAAEMGKCHEIFEEMASFEMRKDWLSTSKVGKVLKRISTLPAEKIPTEAEHDFIGRSKAIALKWSNLMAGGAASASAPAPSSATSATAPAPTADVVESKAEEVEMKEPEQVEEVAPVAEVAAPVEEKVESEVPAAAVVAEAEPAKVEVNGHAEVPVVEAPVQSNGVAPEAVVAPVTEA